MKLSVMVGKLRKLVSPEVLDYLQYVCTNTSSHGGNWLQKIKQPKGKTCYFVLIFSLQLVMFWMVIQKLFVRNTDVSTSLTWENVGRLEYPYITVCNPRAFDINKVKALNIDAELLSYIYLAYASHITVLLAMNRHGTMDSLKKAYNNINVNQTNLGLQLAIRCEDFIIECSGMKCCSEVFDPEPTLSENGACFTSFKQDVQTYAVFGGVFLALNASSGYTASMDSTVIGARAAYTGASLSFHVSDLGLLSMRGQGVSLHKGTFNKIGLKAMDIDRTQEDPQWRQLYYQETQSGCVNTNDSLEIFLKGFGYPSWSRGNCEDFFVSQALNQCSLSLTKGLKIDSSSWDRSSKAFELVFNSTYPPSKLEICHSDSVLEFYQKVTNSSTEEFARIGHFFGLITNICRSECYQKEMSKEKSTNYLDTYYDNELTRDNIYVNIFFANLNKQIIVVRSKQIGEYLSDIGGSIGMIMGASFISIIELLGFYIGFFVLLFKLLCK